MLSVLKVFFNGSQPDWLPSAADVKRLEQAGPCCLFDGATLPHGHRWWIYVGLSGTTCTVEARCAKICSDEQPTLRTASLTADETTRFSVLFQHAATKRGRIRQAFVTDGFPARVRLSLREGLVKFRCNLAVPADDARVELALAMFEVSRRLIDQPSLYGICTADGQVRLGQV